MAALLACALARPAFGQATGLEQITLDEAIQMALQHNHNLLAARTTIPAEPGRGNHGEPAAQSRLCSPIGNICRSARRRIKTPASMEVIPLAIICTIRPKATSAELSVRARQKTAAPAGGRQGHHRGDALAGKPTTSAALRSGRLTLRQCPACGIDARSRRKGFEELSENRGHQRTALQRRRHQRERLPEDQAPVAAV